MIIKSDGTGMGTKFLDDNGNEMKDLRATGLIIEIEGPAHAAYATITTLAPAFEMKFGDSNIKKKIKKQPPVWGRTTTHYS